MKQGLDPKEYLTRGDFFMELLEMWEKIARVSERMGNKKRYLELCIAMEVLKHTYRTSELTDMTTLMGTPPRKPVVEIDAEEMLLGSEDE